MDEGRLRPSTMRCSRPGSPCSIVFGAGLPLGEPGSTKGLQLVVDDLDRASSELTDRGAEVTEVPEVQQLGPEGVPGSRFAFFTDPDGNGWSVQELRRS